MKRIINKIREKEGFTLAELLIVVAIIAVLVAIAIPVFTTQLEKAKEATDAANIRSAYAEVMTSALSQEAVDGVTYNASAKTYTKTVAAKQTQANWQDTSIGDIGGIAVGNGSGQVQAVLSGSNWTITYTESTGKCTITPTNS